MWTMLGAEHPMDAHRADSRGMFYRGQSADALEGVTSFLEKRPAELPRQRQRRAAGHHARLERRPSSASRYPPCSTFSTASAAAPGHAPPATSSSAYGIRDPSQNARTRSAPASRIEESTLPTAS